MSIRYPLILLLGVVGGVLLLGFTSAANGPRKGPPATQIKYYVDPMNPTIISDRPGPAPCGMDFKPVFSNASKLRNSIDSTERQPTSALSFKQTHSVAVEIVQKSEHIQQWRSFGRVVADPMSTYQLKAGSDGVISELFNHGPGSKVRKGEHLASFRAPEMRNTLLGYITTVDVLRRHVDSGITNEAQLTVVRDNVRQATDRLIGLGVSQSQIEQMASSQSAPSFLGIFSPIDGIILSQFVSKDLKFEKGHEWYTISDLTKVWVLGEVSEANLLAVEAGITASVSLPSAPNHTYEARVADGKPTYDATSGTFRIRLVVANGDLMLTPGMPVDIQFRSKPMRFVSVQAKAVLSTGSKSIVFVERTPGSFIPREVSIGREMDRHTEILQGLAPGERIAVDAEFMLDSESSIGMPTASVIHRKLGDPVCESTPAAKRPPAFGRSGVTSPSQNAW